MIIVHLLFGLYFVYTGNRYFCFVPILAMLSISLVSSKKQEIPSLKSLYYDNMFTISWFMIMFGFGGLLYFGHTDIVYIIWLMVMGNSLLLWLSYIRDYEDGKWIFEYGYRLSVIAYICLVVMYWYIQNDVSQTISLLSIIIIYSAALYVWTVTVIWAVVTIPSDMYYKAIFRINAMIMDLIIYIFRGDLIFAMLSGIGYLSFVSWIYGYLSTYYYEYSIPKSIDIKYILKWNRLFDLPPDNYDPLIGNLRNYISQAPYTFQISHNVVITILMTISTIYMFWSNLFGQDIYLLIYIFSIFIYIYNFYLSQKLKLDIEIQKIYIFFMINLVWYMIIYLLSSDIMFRLVGWLLRNWLTSLTIVYYDDIHIMYLGSKFINTAESIFRLRSQDINYRIASNIVWLIMNIYSIVMMNFDNNIKIFFVLLVVWFWAFLMMYVIKRWRS